MKAYFIRISQRNILKNRLYSIINILGIAIGISAFILITVYVKYQKSYDTFYKDYDRIYRLRYERSSAGDESARFASCCPPAAIRIRELYPEAEKIARIFRYRATVIFGDKRYYEERMYFAEYQIFEVFDIKMVTGDAVNGIKNANCAFISESYAKKYFGNIPAMGQTINVDNEMSFVITGIFKDIPDNSHLKFDILLSWPNLITHYGADIESSWGDTGFFTYLVLKPGVDPQVFENKLKTLVESDFGEVLRSYKLTLDLKLQSLTDIHMNSNYMQEMEINGNKDSVRFLSIIAYIILLIAWVNYINITTARALTRALEVGLSKVTGASKLHLSLQFFTETFIINLAAFFASLFLLVLIFPAFSNLTGIPSGFSMWVHYWFWIMIGLLFISSIIISGVYPVFVLTSFKTSEALRGKYIHSKVGIFTRKLLVLFQLLMAISLITCTLFVFKQLSFLQSVDKGISTSGVLAVRAPRVRDASFGSRLTTFREELIKTRSVLKFSVGTEVPGRQIIWDAGGIFRVGSDQSKNYQILGIDYDYLDLFEATFLAGRNFGRSYSTDSSSLILNETATKWMGFNSPDEAVDQKVNYWGKIYSVVGVVKDYRQQSPKESFEPQILRFMPHGRDIRGFFILKLIPGNEAMVLKVVEEKFNLFFPDNAFDFFFLEDYYSQQYRDEIMLGIVFGIFALLSIIITCLGIFGLTSFLMLQKTKEIGIRRVVGSGIPGIIIQFSKDFVVITTIAFIAAIPICWYWVTGWLKSFEVKMDLSAWIFIYPFILTILLTTITISFIIWKTASMNPAVSLRSE